MAKAGFRPEIQALRAVAVLLVLAFHLVPRVAPGGYVGVDVFFVISGFLITSHLVSEAVSTGGISLPRFWARRIRRLVPAATLVIVASFVAMLLFVPRSLWQQTVIELGASALYVQNWVLGANAVDYLAAENDPTIVQHYWSLSVEEQFYIVWPVLLLLAVLLVRSRSSARVTKAAIVGVLSIIFVVSLAYSIWLTAANPALAYFNTGTRAWEFAAGGLLALVPVTWAAGIRRRLGELPATLASWAGLGMIGAAALLLRDDTPFPGYAALLPVIGTVLVISGGVGVSSWSPQSLTRFGPLQFVGDLSYSIYLWHWPLLIGATGLLGRTPGWKWALLIAFASIALAWLTKVIVEDPVRRGEFWRARLWRPYALAAVSITAVVAASSLTWIAVERGIDESRQLAAQLVETQDCFGAAAILESGCDVPFAVPAWLDTAFATEDEPQPGSNCDMREGTEVRICLLGEFEDPTTTIAIVGNSHATHFLPALTRFGEDRGWQIVHMTRRSCLGVTTEPVANPAPDQGCLDWSAGVQDELHEIAGLDAVIFSSYRGIEGYIAPDDPTESELDELRAQIASTYRSYVDEDIAVIVIGDTASTPRRGPECIDLHQREYDPCASDRAYSPENLMTEAAHDTSGVHYVDPTDWLCTDGTCHALIGGVVVYSDHNHFTTTFAKTLAPYLGAEIEEALAAR